MWFSACEVTKPRAKHQPVNCYLLKWHVMSKIRSDHSASSSFFPSINWLEWGVRTYFMLNYNLLTKMHLLAHIPGQRKSVLVFPTNTKNLATKHMHGNVFILNWYISNTTSKELVRWLQIVVVGDHLHDKEMLC